MPSSLEDESPSQELPDAAHVPAVPDPAPAAAPDSVASRRRPRLGGRNLLVVAIAAAVIGAGSALAVARATGWGTRTVVNQYIRSGQIGSGSADVHAILAKVLPSVVSVSATSTRPSPFFNGHGSTVTSTGTGVIVSRDGEVVTNDHVVSGATSVRVTLSGSSTPLAAIVLGESPNGDLALLKVTGRDDLTAAQFDNSSASEVGDQVLAVGYALGLSGGPTVTEGIVSATGRQVTTQTATGTSVTLTGMLQTDAAISSGNSGGPLLNAAAQVIGINTAVAASSSGATAQNIGFAIPSSTVTQLLAQLRSGR